MMEKFGEDFDNENPKKKFEYSNDNKYNESTSSKLDENDIEIIDEMSLQRLFDEDCKFITKNDRKNENDSDKIEEIFNKLSIPTHFQLEFNKLTLKQTDKTKLEKAIVIDNLSDYDSKRLKILELLSSGKYQIDDEIDSNFSTIILNRISNETIKIALNSESFIDYLKPFIFDALKRFHRLTSVKTAILNFVNSKDSDKSWIYLNKIEERDLICPLIQKLNSKSKAKFGKLLVNNEYPIPIMFSICNDGKLEYTVEFDTLNDLLLLSTRSLIIVSGTKNAIFKGKTSLISFLFCQKPVFKSKSRSQFLKNNVDFLIHDDNWIIIDFHSEIESEISMPLLKAFKLFCSLHIINVTINDFNSDGTCKEELKLQLEYFDNTSSTILIILRDYCEEMEEQFDLIESKIKTTSIKIFKIENISDQMVNDDETLSYKKDNFIKELDDVIRDIPKAKIICSINDIKNIYRSSCEKVFQIQTEFNELFHGYDSNMFSAIFPIASINSNIKELKDKLNIIGYYNPKRDEIDNEIRKNENELLNINPFTPYVKFFIKILLDENFLSNITVFENFLINMKCEKLKILRESRIECQEKLLKLNEKLKQLVPNLIKSNDELRMQRNELEQDLRKVDNQIDIFDLTIDKFWHEVFSIYDWIIFKEKEYLNFSEDVKNDVEEFKVHINDLIDRYISLFKYGFAIHILRGKPLKIESKALEMVFDRLNSDSELFIITVIGEQSSAKSSLMNSLFGSDFRTSAGRCTIGIYMNIVNYENKKVVILDTEGLMSVESGSKLFDNQLATMAVLSSHMIIVNHKGEISSNLERLLGITFYAKLQISNSVFKPLVMFVLRDQSDRQQSSVSTQAAKLKFKLIEQSAKIKQNIDDVMNIETKDVVLLPNAFAEDKAELTNKVVKWRNKVFPDEILELRKLIFDKLVKMDRNGHCFNSLGGLYNSMCSYWKTIEGLGNGILNCKDLEEIKMRNEIATICSKLTSDFNNSFYAKCQLIRNEALAQMDKDGYDYKIYNQTIDDLNNYCRETVAEMKKDFEKYTNISYFPDEIKHEFLVRIEQSLNRTKYINLTDFTTDSNYIKETKQLEHFQQEMIKYASDLIKNSTITETFWKQLRERMIKFDQEYENYLHKLFEPDESFIKKIQDCYNQNHGQDIYVDKFEFFKGIPTIDDLEDFIKNKKVIDPQKWFDNSLKNTMTNFIKGIYGSQSEYAQLTKWINSELKNEIIPKAIHCITLPHVEDAHIRNVYEIIHSQIFNKNSPVLKNKKYFKISELIIDLFRKTFAAMYDRYIEMKRKEIENKKANYNSLKDQLINQIEDNIEKMENSKTYGLTVAAQLNGLSKQILLKDFEKNTKQLINKELIEILKDPTEIVDRSFKMSFLSSDYQEVWKYVTNINKYCLEIAKRITKHKVEAIIMTENGNLQSKLNEFMKKLSSLELDFEPKRVHDFIHSIIELLANDTDFKELLMRAKYRMFDFKIENAEQFLASFKEEITKKSKCIDIDTEEIKKDSESYLENYLKRFLGCSSTCPGCGSKCNLEIGHDGSHKSNHHILNGFSGWHEKESKIIATEYCWDEDFYLNTRIVHKIENKTYDNFKTYLKELYPDWSNEIEEKYVKYFGGDSKQQNQEFLDFDYFMRKAWMNVRLPLIKKSKLIDKQYDQEWLKLEEKNKMLDEKYCIEGYSKMDLKNYSLKNFLFGYNNDSDDDYNGNDYDDYNDNYYDD